MTDTNQENESAQEPQAEVANAETQQPEAQPKAEKETDGVKEEVVQKGEPAQELQTVEQVAIELPTARKLAAKNADTGKQKRPFPSKNKKHKKTHRKGKRTTPHYDKMVAHFAACGRCSYFLAGYRVLHGVENLETAVEQSPTGKLDLSWNFDMRNLLTKSYGITFYIDHLHIEAVCPECGRQYGYSAGDDDKEDSFYIEMSRHRK